MGERDKRLIVMGASAGGLSALSAILSTLPRDFSIPIALVQHLDQTSESKLVQVLQMISRLPVREALDKDEITPGVVHVAPPNYHLAVEDDFYFSLAVDDEVSFSRPSIDVLFSSAADALGDKLTGVLLSGANRDGADGLARIRDLGGHVVVQEPKSAEFYMMPAAGIESTTPDFIGSPENIAKYLQARFKP